MPNRTTELIAEPGARVEVQDLNGNWLPATFRGIERCLDDTRTLYWVEFQPSGTFLVQESDIRLPQEPALES